MSRRIGLTVLEILALPALKEARLISGADSLNDRVTLINIMADPEILDWIDQGQMLAMTGYSLPAMTGEEQLIFFKTCHEKGIITVAIKLKPYLESLDPQILAYLEDANFPVIEVPAKVPLSQLNSEVTNALFTQQSHIMEGFEDIHQKFMDIILAGGGPSEIISILANYINNPVIFEVSYSKELISNWRSLLKKDQELIWDDYEHFRNDRTKRRERRITEHEFIRGGRKVRRKSIPIVLRDNIFGYLTSWSFDSQLNSFDLSIMEVAATVLSLLIMQSLSLREVEVKFASEFYEDLISQDDTKRERAMETHAYFDLRTTTHFAVLRAELQPESEFTEEHINLAMRRLIHFLSPELENLRYSFELDGILSTRSNALNIVLGFSNPRLFRRVMEKLTLDITGICQHHFSGFILDMGIGRLKNSWNLIGESHLEATHSLAVFARSRDKRQLFYEDLGIYSLLFHEGQDQEMEEFTNRMLAPLEAYDVRMKEQFFETLEAYFQTGGNLMEMSRILFLHYNSVLYRLNRIQEITGLDLADEDQKLNLAIALKIRKLIHKEVPKEG